MTLTPSIRKSAALAALTAVAGSAAFSGSASAATIDRPVVLGPSERIPIDFGGYKEPADRKLPKNHRIVRVSTSSSSAASAPRPCSRRPRASAP